MHALSLPRHSPRHTFHLHTSGARGDCIRRQKQDVYVHMAPKAPISAAGQRVGSANDAETDDVELTQLISACAARDAQALRQLYDRTAPQLLACMVRILKRKALAEEALQDVFVSIWQRASQFEVRRGRPRAWLTSI